MKRVFFCISLYVSVACFGVDITIPPGATAVWLANELKRADVIQNAYFFRLYMHQNRVTNRIHQGTFSIEKNTPYADIIDIVTGKKQQLIRVTIPEGFTLNEITTRLHATGVISDPGEFLDFIHNKNAQVISDQLATESIASHEGLFFADTYYFQKNMPFSQVYTSLTNPIIEQLVPEYTRYDAPPLSFYDTLILASIIEKEAGTPSEMPLISGVFHNRLRKNMPLGSCPTVSYALGEPRKKQLLYTDLTVESPYNTYKYAGLPPTPIAAPSKTAFLAALSPAETPYLYFVAKNDGSGTHFFSKTLTEHLTNQQNTLLTQTQ
jgi:UPF0755 protein